MAHETIDRIVVLYFPDEIDAAVNLSFSFRTAAILLRVLLISVEPRLHSQDLNHPRLSTRLFFT